MQTLTGHTARVFNIVWHPHFEYILASGSDDKTLRVWDIKNSGTKELKGHSHNVRGISWNYEIPWLLLSGAWDMTIRVWDVRTTVCIQVIYDHHADIYGLSSHSQRPFVYCTCSRDTTIRFWSAQELIMPAMVKMVLGADLHDMIGDPHDSMVPDVVPKLCGIYSKTLFEALKLEDGINILDKYKDIFMYFMLSNGQIELWDILNVIANNVPGKINNRILHMSDMAGAYLSKAQFLESSTTMSMLGTALTKKEDRMMECAKIYLKLGQVKEYCEILISFNMWEKALAFAPYVNIDYWQTCALRHAQYLRDRGSEEAGHYSLLAHDIQGAMDSMVNRGDYEDAKLIKILAELGGIYI